MKTILLFVSAAAVLAAQETIQYASVGGRVTDESGGVMEGARVTARHLETNRANVAVTDGEGRFRFPYLRPGRYEFTAEREGFATVLRTLTLTLGAAFELPLTLPVGAAAAGITVSGEAPVLDTARTQVSVTVPQTEIASLPLNGRNFLDVALLVPGVSPTNTASTQLFPETSAVPGQGLSVSSQRNFSNNFVVDGLSANDDAAGLSGLAYGLSVVSEFQVVTSGGQAEFGRALGGYFNVVTKSGSNTLHGDLYGYFRNRRFNAPHALLNRTLPLTQAQYGASLGGPAITDRLFYFANFERRELNQSGLSTIAAGNVAAINAKLAAVRYPGSPVSTGLYPNPVHNTDFLAKADHQLSARDQFTVRYSLYDVHGRNTRGAGGLSAPTASAGLDNTDQTIAAGNILELSSRMVNETRGQFTRGNLGAPPSDPAGPAVSISGVASFGTLSGSPTGRLNTVYEIADNFSYQAGSHAFRAGADFLYNRTTITFPRSLRGGYAFSSLSNFLNGTYSNAGFTQTFGATVVGQGNPNAGFYAQDEWKAGSRLTLNLGLRYDLQFLETIQTDTNNFSPRAGFAWSPFASRRTVVRGSYGFYYDRVPLRALANALLSAGNTTDPGNLRQRSVSLSPSQAGAPVFPDILANLTVPPGVLFNLTTMDRRMQNAYSRQTSFEIEQQIGAGATFSAGYQRLSGLHLIMSVNQNVPACAAAGTNNACRPEPAYANNSRYSPLADSSYQGLHISFVQRPARWGGYRISYTYSKALDNVGEFFFSSPVDHYDIWKDWGRSDDDQRHRLVFNGVVHSHGFQLGGTLQYYSALPFNILTGSNTIQGTAARPIVNGAYIPRNAGIGFDFLNVNTRLSRTFQLSGRLRVEAIAEAFNLLNRTNGVTLNNTFGPGVYPAGALPSFRTTTAVAEPRSMQFALRFSF